MKISSKWASQPRKMRKYMIYEAPLHKKRKLMVAPLAPEAREKYGIRRFVVRVGDKVIIRKGKYKNQVGKIIRVNVKRLFIYLDSLTRKRSDGTVVHIPIRPWNVAILELDLSDPKRRKAFERKAKLKEVSLEEILPPEEEEEVAEAEETEEEIIEEILKESEETKEEGEEE